MMLEYVKYAIDKNEVMTVVLRELGYVRVKKARRKWKWMVLLLRLCVKTNEKMIEAVKFLE